MGATGAAMERSGILKKGKQGLTILVVILFLLITGFGTLVTFLTDYLWFRELGYVSVFFKQLFTQLKIGVPVFLVISLLTYLYLRMLKRDYYKKVDTVDAPAVSEKTVNLVSLALGAVFAILITISVASQFWFEILQYLAATPFGKADPIFGMDVSFYVFKLVLINQMSSTIIGLIIGFAILTFLYYFFLMSVRRPKMFDRVQQEPAGDDGGQDQARRSPFGAFGQQFNQQFGGQFGQQFGQQFNQQFGGGGGRRTTTQFNKDNLHELVHLASRQIIVLGVLFFLMVGANFFLQQFSLLYSRTGVLYGAGFTDINVTLWKYRALIVLAGIAAITLVMGIRKKNYKLALAVPVIMILVSAAGSGIAMAVQNLIVSPDEINKESKYLEYNIAFTRSAYDLQDITVEEFPANNKLTKDDILNNMGTISNIRINDYEPAKKFYNQTQSIRLYYLFNDVDVDRYMINGDYTQTFLSAREIDETRIREEWINKHLKYTHGYGITLSRVDKVTASGQPDMLIDSIPPVSDVEEIQITRPEIYFGELTNNYIITNTDEQEFDYPSGEDNIYSTYEGTAGIKLNMFNRLLFAIREQSLKMLVSTNIDSNSRIIINRNIEKRVQKIMPFLEYDADPYIVTADGKLYWIIDAYTYSTHYPYSEPFAPETNVNYIRNSVKVVIDAYSGETNYYLVDDEDPVAATYAKIYPELFKSFDQMPASLQAHVRYPNMLFNIQANVYKRYHMSNVKVFYQGEDLWDISSEIFGTSEVPMTPNYYIMKLPGEEKEEFINSIPYTPKGKKNMTGLLVARNDNGNYGELVLYRLPKDKITYGPMQIESQIDQDTTISKEFSLWSQAGSTYIRGNMFVIPIEGSLLYVEPVYLEAANENSLPEVKRVIVAYGDRIAYKPTLAEALDALFGSGALNQGGTAGGTGGTETPAPGSPSIPTTDLTLDQLIQLANQAFADAQAAQQSGDWAAYGNYLSQLESYLQQLAGSQAPDDITGTDFNQ